MTSEAPSSAFVWVWLPGATEPVVCGRIDRAADRYQFTYARSYRERSDAVALSPVELPLEQGPHIPVGLRAMHGCLRDAAPDAWGRRVIGYRHPDRVVDELGYLLMSGSNRVGALDFQPESGRHLPRGEGQVRLDQLLEAANLVQSGSPLPPSLDAALLHGTSVGGARPKAWVVEGTTQYIAKFSASTDTYDIVKAEFIAMRLAARAGLTVAPVQLRQVLGRDVLLVERFDRVPVDGGVDRRSVLSILGLLQLDEMEAGYASSRDFAALILRRFESPKTTLHEVFRRLAFNVLIGNTDDHARNHAALWNGRELELAPAYDLCPQRRTGGEASQAMTLDGDWGQLSTLANVCSLAPEFLLTPSEARTAIEQLVDVVRDGWRDACDEAGMPDVEREKLLGPTVLSPFAFDGW